MIYKITPKTPWEKALACGVFEGAQIDLVDGYIHFSTAEQVAETAAKHFTGQDDLLLAAVDDTALGDKLKWEKSRGDALFPHLYRHLKMSEVVWTKPLPLGENGQHILPSLDA